MITQSNDKKKEGQVKVKVEEPDVVDDMAPPPATKRGRGRPKKVVQAGDERSRHTSKANSAKVKVENPDDDDDMAPPPPTKRGRGRPRKVLQDGVGEGAEISGAPVVPIAPLGNHRLPNFHAPQRDVKQEFLGHEFDSNGMVENFSVPVPLEDPVNINNQMFHGPGPELVPQASLATPIAGMKQETHDYDELNGNQEVVKVVENYTAPVPQQIVVDYQDTQQPQMEFQSSGSPVIDVFPIHVKEEPQDYDEQFENRGRVEEYIAPKSLEEMVVDQDTEQPLMEFEPPGSPVIDVFPIHIKEEPQDYEEQSENQIVADISMTPVPFQEFAGDSHQPQSMLQPGDSPATIVSTIHIKEESQDYEEQTADVPPFENPVIEDVEPAEWVGTCVKVPDEKWKRWEEEREAGMKDYMTRLTEECRRFDPRILEMFEGRISELNTELILLLQRGSEATGTWKMCVSTDQLWRVMAVLRNHTIPIGSINVKRLVITTTFKTRCINAKMLARWMAYIDPAALQKISIRGNFTHGALRQLSKTEQWRSCKVIELESKNMFTFNLLFKNWKGTHVRVLNVVAISNFADEWKSFVQAFKRKSAGSSFEIRAKEYNPFPAHSYMAGKVRVTTSLSAFKGVVETN